MNQRELDKRTLHALLRLQQGGWQANAPTPLPPEVRRLVREADLPTLESLLVEVTRRLEAEHFRQAG